MIVSIHQANFMPWYPFFQKIEKADIFVVMVNCQFERSNFQNRFNIGETWYTMSINQKMSDRICDKKYVKHEIDWKRIKDKLKKQYDLSVFDDLISEDLMSTNVGIIERVSDMLGIKTSIVKDYPTSLLRTERLVDICSQMGATSYLSGISGRHYLDVGKFEEKGIKVDFQNESEMIKIPILEKLHRDKKL